MPLFIRLKLGSVLGFLAAGIAIGPYGLGVVHDIGEIHHLAEYGVVFLLFLIGIETKPARLWLMRRTILGLGLGQFLLVGSALGGLLHFGLDYSWKASLVAGFAGALSSTAMGFQIMTEQHVLGKPYGRAAFAVLLFQDVIVVPFMAVLPLLTESGGGTEDAFLDSFLTGSGILIGFFLILKYLLPPFFRLASAHARADVFTMAALFLVLGSALLLSSTGFSMALGAFLAGIMISSSEFRHQVTADIEPFRNLLLGLFFMLIGMTVDLTFFYENPAAVLVVTLLFLGVKLLFMQALGRLYGLSWTNSGKLSALLSQGGEFAFVLFGIANVSGLLSTEQTVFLTLCVALSMVTTPLLFTLCNKMPEKRMVVDAGTPRLKEAATEEDAPEIIIVGCGYLGTNLARLFNDSGINYLALDHNQQLIKERRAEGYNVFYGNILTPQLFQVAGIAHAKAVVVATHNFEKTDTIVQFLRHLYPKLYIFARTKNATQAQILSASGADHVIVEELETGLSMGRSILKTLRVPVKTRTLAVARFRKDVHEILGITPEDPPPPPKPLILTPNARRSSSTRLAGRTSSNAGRTHRKI